MPAIRGSIYVIDCRMQDLMNCRRGSLKPMFNLWARFVGSQCEDARGNPARRNSETGDMLLAGDCLKSRGHLFNINFRPHSDGPLERADLTLRSGECSLRQRANFQAQRF